MIPVLLAACLLSGPTWVHLSGPPASAKAHGPSPRVKVAPTPSSPSAAATPEHRPSRLTPGGTSGVDWDGIAQCESSGNWSINTGNGYYGGLQMNMDFWRTYGGLRFASRPDLATKAEQILVAEAGYRARGLEPWACGWAG